MTITQRVSARGKNSTHTARRNRSVVLALLLAVGWHTLGASIPLVAQSAPLSETLEATAAPPSAPEGAAEVLVSAAEPTSGPGAAESVRVSWHGQIARPANVRISPRLRATPVRELRPGTPVQVLRWVTGDAVETDNPTWAEIAPGEFVYGMLLRPDAPPEPVWRSDAPTSGRWIDVDVTHQIATAYEGARPIHTTLVSTGRPDWQTPNGTWPIQRRVEQETMDGNTLTGQGPAGQGASYRVEHVRWTQYFTADGSAIHENYWRDPGTFGIPGSHGCVGMAPNEAEWFWRWAEVGTSLVIHSSAT